MSILIKNANILTFDTEDRELSQADVLIKDTKIVAVGRIFLDHQVL